MAEAIVILTDVGIYRPSCRAVRLLLIAPKRKSGYFDKRYKLSRVAIRYERKAIAHATARWVRGENAPLSSSNGNVMPARLWWKAAKAKGLEGTLAGALKQFRLENNQG